MRKLHLPDPRVLQKTSDVDYFHWNYRFPIRVIQRFRFSAMLELMHGEIYDRLLEIGTGSGVFLPELALHCRELYACDIHNRMKAVRQVCAITGTRAKLTRCSIEDMPYPDEMFDAIVAVSVLEFVNDLGKALGEITRVMRPDAVFLAICPKKQGLSDYLLSLYIRKNPEEEFRDARSKVSPMLEDHFRVVEKKVFPPLLDKLLPVYSYYRLAK